jgi:alkylated DNA repair protein (DNA oxidative demethylase)
MDLFDESARDVPLGEGAVLLGAFARQFDAKLLAAVNASANVSPLRHMTTPGGHRMSVAMTNCGGLGWVTDRTGYRYDLVDPETGRAWPDMRSLFVDLAASAAEKAGFLGFLPDACLINRYSPGARLTLHQNRNETDFGAPIVSVSLGLPAVFLWGGLSRTDRARRMRLTNGDVVVWGGPSRLTFHGIDTLNSGEHELTGAFRFNLTFRRAG